MTVTADTVGKRTDAVVPGMSGSVANVKPEARVDACRAPSASAEVALREG